jgi:Ca-activated chloride channel homolog
MEPQQTNAEQDTPELRALKKLKKQRRQSLAEYTAVVGLIALACLGLISMFGDNIRRLFGMSSDALGGDDNIARRNTTRAAAAVTDKTMRNFGQNNVYSGSGSFFPSAPAAVPAAVPVAMPVAVPVAPPNGDTHQSHVANAQVEVAADRFSTFAVDVDTASYAYGRQALRQRMLPQASSVRVEEWVNAFRYQLPAPKDAPYAVHTALARAPFDAGKALLKVSLQGKKVANADRKPAHLVWLVDVSGSMSGPTRLGLAQESMRVLLESLNARDTVAIVTYAGEVRDVLPPTSAKDKERIHAAIDSLSSGGGTSMSDGMTLAYAHAVKNVGTGKVSRVMVFSDGDANIGHRSHTQILEDIQNHVKEGVMMTTIGFGMGNYRASAMEQLADKGNGQALYFDSRDEAQRAFGPEGVAGTLETIAKDVKVQVEFDLKRVKKYRLVGYENRDVADQDFRNDAVDGGELGAGHAVTAVYELELTGEGGALAVVRVRGQKLDGQGAFEVAETVKQKGPLPSLEDAEVEMRFASAVALASDLMRGSSPEGEKLQKLAQLAGGATRGLADRSEFVNLLEQTVATRWPALARR